jgi:hypothetical protein
MSFTALPSGCDGQHPFHDEIRAAGFMLLCLQAVFAGDAAVRAQAAAGAARAVQGWVKHFPPPWAVKAELVHMVKQAPGACTFGVDESDVHNGSIMLYEVGTRIANESIAH